jgi:hypothetical protein
MSTLDIQQYLAEPGGHVILRPDLTIAAIGPRYSRETGITEDDVGKSIYDAIPTTEVLRPSFERVLATHQTDQPGTIRYDVHTTVGLQERWWEVANIPLVEKGEVQYIVHRVEDATTLVKTQQAIRHQGIVNRTLYCFLAAAVTVGVYFGIHQAHIANQLSQDTHQLLTTGRQQRFQTLSEVCAETDQLSRKLKAILVQSTVATKAFDKQLTSLGFPPYKQRLASAQSEADSLSLIDCQGITPSNKKTH